MAAKHSIIIHQLIGQGIIQYGQTTEELRQVLSENLARPGFRKPKPPVNHASLQAAIQFTQQTLYGCQITWEEIEGRGGQEYWQYAIRCMREAAHYNLSLSQKSSLAKYLYLRDKEGRRRFGPGEFKEDWAECLVVQRTYETFEAEGCTTVDAEVITRMSESNRVIHQVTGLAANSRAGYSALDACLALAWLHSWEVAKARDHSGVSLMFDHETVAAILMHFLDRKSNRPLVPQCVLMGWSVYREGNKALEVGQALALSCRTFEEAESIILHTAALMEGVK